jgi:hypothetical protein
MVQRALELASGEEILAEQQLAKSNGHVVDARTCEICGRRAF